MFYDSLCLAVSKLLVAKLQVLAGVVARIAVDSLSVLVGLNSICNWGLTRCLY